MRIHTVVAALLLLAAGTTLAAPQAKAPSDPPMIDAQGFQKVLEKYHGDGSLTGTGGA